MSDGETSFSEMADSAKEYTIGIPNEELSDSFEYTISDEAELTIDKKKVDRTAPEKNFNPTLIIGLGGTGIQAVDTLKGLMIEKSESRKVRPGLSFIGFDCNKTEVNSCKYLQPNVEVFGLTLNNPRLTYEGSANELDWVTQKVWPPNAEYGAGQYRQVSRMCFIHHMDDVLNHLKKAVNPILPMTKRKGRVKLDIYIICSICGGAGSGMLIDVAAILRRLPFDVDFTVIGMLVTGDVYQRYQDIHVEEQTRIMANSYACLKELQYLQDMKNPHNIPERQGGKPLIFRYTSNSPYKTVPVTRPPFDLLMLIHSQNAEGKPILLSPDQLRHFLSSTLFLMTSTPMTANQDARIVNPQFGLNVTFERVNGTTQRVFSSVGYLKFMYPEESFINYLNGVYGELLLSHFLDGVKFKLTAKEKSDPTAVNINAFIEKIADKHVDDYNFEFHDYMTHINKSLKGFDSFNKMDLFQRVMNIVESAKWQELTEKIESFEKSSMQKIDDNRNNIINGINEKSNSFYAFLDRLPAILLDSGVGIRHIKQYFAELAEELDKEEHIANERLKGIEKNQMVFEQEWKVKKDDVFRYIGDPPTFFRESKLKARLDEYSKSYTAYLNCLFEVEKLQGVLHAYRVLDGMINQRTRIADKILIKLDQVLHKYRGHKTEYKNILIKIAGEKTPYSYQNEYSVISLKELNKMMRRFLESKENDPDQKMKILFGQEGWSFWKMRDTAYTPEKILLYMQENIQSQFNGFKVSLSEIAKQAGLDRAEVLKRFTALKESLRAQWVPQQTEASVKPRHDTMVAYPKHYASGSGTENPAPTSDRVIEALRLEFGLPAQLLGSTKRYREYYDQVEKETPKSMHIIPEAMLWPEVDTFPNKAEAEMLKIFALGIAYGYIYEPEENEREKLDSKYGNKGYTGFIFQRKPWYLLMPFYELPARSGLMKDKVISLGQGRMAAFQEFRRHPEYAELVKQWIEDRIIHHYDINLVLEKMDDYIDRILDKEKTEDREQIEQEKAALYDYIENARNYKTLGI